MGSNWDIFNAMRKEGRIGNATASIDAWVDVACKIDEGARETGARLYASYCKFAGTKGDEPMRQRLFLLALSEHRVPRAMVDGVRYWLGLALLDEWVGVPAIRSGEHGKVIAEWAMERCTADQYAVSMVHDMYTDYLAWCASSHRDIASKVVFGGYLRDVPGLTCQKRLTQLEYMGKFSQMMHYLGIGLKNTPTRKIKFDQAMMADRPSVPPAFTMESLKPNHVKPAYDDSDDI